MKAVPFCFAILVNLRMTMSRFSREMWSTNSTPVEVVDLVLEAHGEDAVSRHLLRCFPRGPGSAP